MHKRRLLYALFFMVAIGVLAVMLALRFLKIPTGSDQAITKQVPPPTIEAPANLPAKVQEIVRKLATIKEGILRRDVIMHLGFDKDEAVKHLYGGGSLGEGYESYDLGINDEWILTIYYNSGVQDVFEVALERGSVSKFRKNEDQQWELYYPYWSKGLMIEKPHKKRDPEQDGADQPATAPESTPEGNQNPKAESEVRPQ